MNLKWMLVLCFILHKNYVISQLSIENDRCSTPLNGTGLCVVIHRCKPIITFKKYVEHSLSQENSDLFKKYTCGNERNILKVCCPKNASEIERLERGTFSRVEGSISERNVSDVTSHKNLGLLPKDCGHIQDSKLISGTAAQLFEFPWTALIYHRKSQGLQFICAGAVINERYILTAGHCLYSLNFSSAGVRLGEHDLRTNSDCDKMNTTCASPVQDVGIECIIVHQGFKKMKFEHDIGLIRLSTKLKFNNNVAAICLPVTQESINYNLSNQVVTVASFGLNQIGKVLSNLERNEVSLIEKKECEKFYANVSLISEGHFCAEFKNRETFCGVDSGGPLQVPMFLHGEIRAVQQGISSFGVRICGVKGYPDGFTRVSYYMKWILDNISP
ncbi:hypothetical protein WA026_022416 [Henosepilachna vigintioctopunctata]|uniref:CLIP domain-containing serine protease n=1 Tax=Henosepilachna vigintioctopunctata TaxID=420089 RepID=A0AAW1UGS4_9CUCU